MMTCRKDTHPVQEQQRTAITIVFAVGRGVKLLSLLEIITSHDLVCKQVPMLPELSVCSPKRIHMYIFIWPLSLKRFLDSNVGKATVLRLLLLLLLSFFSFQTQTEKTQVCTHIHIHICIYIYITCMHTYLHVYACKVQLPSEMRCPGGPQCKKEQQKQRNKTSISIHRQQQ